MVGLAMTETAPLAYKHRWLVLTVVLIAEIMDLLDKSAVSYQIVLTKVDELKKGEAEKRAVARFEANMREASALVESIRR